MCTNGELFTYIENRSEPLSEDQGMFNLLCFRNTVPVQVYISGLIVYKIIMAVYLGLSVHGRWADNYVSKFFCYSTFLLFYNYQLFDIIIFINNNTSSYDSDSWC